MVDAFLFLSRRNFKEFSSTSKFLTKSVILVYCSKRRSIVATSMAANSSTACLRSRSTKSDEDTATWASLIKRHVGNESPQGMPDRSCFFLSMFSISSLRRATVICNVSASIFFSRIASMSIEFNNSFERLIFSTFASIAALSTIILSVVMVKSLLFLSRAVIASLILIYSAGNDSICIFNEAKAASVVTIPSFNRAQVA